MNSLRPYSMTRRRQAADETRTRILRAAFDLAMQKMTVQIALRDVAERAGVSVQTVLRHFGSRQGLLEGTRDYGNAVVGAERRAPVGDPDADIAVLLDHYELRGDSVMRFLAEALLDPEVDLLVAGGRQLHRDWVATVFAPQLAGLGPKVQEAVLDQLVVVTDVYSWKLLRRDRGLDRETVEQRMRDMAHSVIATATEGE